MTQVTRRDRARLTILVLALLVGPLVSSAFAVSVPGNYSTIQAAINAVVNGSLPDGTTIDVQPGVYAEALVVANTGKSFTVRGLGGAASTFVDAAGRGAAALTVYRSTGHVAFKGLTFRNGAPPVAAGGGFVITESSPSFVNCTFDSNVAQYGGGGALVTSNATFTNSIIRNNRATRSGGGVYMIKGSRPVFTQTDIVSNRSGTGPSGVGNVGVGGGIDARNSSPTFQSSRINSNVSTFAAGGIYHGGEFGSAYGTATLAILDSEVNDNVTASFSPSDPPAEGGAVHIEDNAVANLTRARILRNRANTGGGLNAYRAHYEIVDSIIDSNQATGRSDGGFGGGINGMSTNVGTVRPASVVTLTGSLVRNNVGLTGGGVVITGDVGLPATLTVTGTVIDSNKAQSQGGGILASRANLSLSNSMIIRNTVSGDPVSPFGGGILLTLSSSATINGTTIAANTAAAFGGGIFMDGTAALQMTGSNVYANSAGSRGGGIFVGPNGSQTGSIKTSTLADNATGQIQEEACSALTYQNNTITPTAFTGCNPGGRATGTDAGPPRFEHFLAAPRSGASTELAWSVARATSVTVAGVGTWNAPNNAPTGSVDLVPTASATYTLTATASSGNGGDYGSAGADFTFLPPPVFGSHAVEGDFDGNGGADTTVFRPSDGVWYSRFTGSGLTSAFRWGVPGDVPVASDYDGDGKVDVAVYRPSEGVWYIQQSSTASAVAYRWGASSDVPVPADYDGDGKTDIAIFREGVWYLWYSSTGGTAAVRWGVKNDLPVPGDYDGDGKIDIAVYRPSEGVWYLMYSSTGTTNASRWGSPGDVPVQADYDGDGKADIAVFRPANGAWYFWYSSNGAQSAFQWGVGTDVAVPGDYDGDGKTDAAIYRPSQGAWYVRYSGNGATFAVQWGVSSDIPILKR